MSNDFALRLVAYEPNGDVLGQLPDALPWDFSSQFNGVSTLKLKYPRAGRNFELLDEACEVAVEYRHNGAWEECRNGRFCNIEQDIDGVDPEGVVTFSMVGYSFVLLKAIVDVPPGQRDKWGKRMFGTDRTAGFVMKELIDEAKARGALPGLTYNFTGTKTTSGEDWLNEDSSMSWDPGSDLRSVLESLAESNMCDFAFQGRELVMENPVGLSMPRYSAKVITSRTDYDTGTWISNRAGGLNSEREKAFGRWSPVTRSQPRTKAVKQIAHAAGALSTGGYPRPNWTRFYDVGTGQDNTLGYVRPVGWMNMTPYNSSDPEARDYYMGSLLCDQGERISWLLAIDDATNTSMAMANGVWAGTGGGAILVNDSVREVGAQSDVRSGYVAQALALAKRGINTIEFNTFQRDEDFQPRIVIQYGDKPNPKLANKFRDWLAHEGFTEGLHYVLDHGDSKLTRNFYDVTPPKAPTPPRLQLIQQSENRWRININWDGRILGGKTDDFSHVECYIRATDDALFEPSEGDRIAPNRTKHGRWAMLNLNENTNYVIKLRTVDTHGNKSQYSGWSSCNVTSVDNKPHYNLGGPGHANRGPSGEAFINRDQLPDDLKRNTIAMDHQSNAGHGRYIRILVAEEFMENSTNRNKLVNALHGTFTELKSSTPKIPHTGPKEKFGNQDPDAQPAEEQVERPGPVEILMGKDLTDSPTTRSIADLASRVFVFGESWVQLQATNRDAWTPWGQFEVAVAQGGVTDEDTLQGLAWGELNKGGSATESYTRGVRFEAATWLPFLHYDVGDIITSTDSVGDDIPMQIQQMVISQTAEGLTGSLVMADRFLDAEVKKAKQIKAAAGGVVGGTRTGGSGSRPQARAADTRKPLPPILY